MFWRIVLATLVTAAAAGLGYASGSNSTTIVIGKQPASSGRQMYTSYCASCHGMDGRGNGPLASSLNITPADLTQLSKNNHGRYPEHHVILVLQSGASTPEHGTTAMPVWGSVFAQMDGGQRSLTRALRISNLSEYLKTIQAN